MKKGEMMKEYNYDFIEAVKLKKFKINIKKVIPESLWLGLDPTVYVVRDLCARELVLSFNTYVWSEQLQNEKQIVSYPETIW
jgi:hypothetical protein